jgi:predicted short-subunit dehydrogenase-like oxidoreductase (DUF2520 family)
MNSLPKNLVFIGAGRVAYSVAGAVNNAEFCNINVISTNIESARIFAEKYSYNSYSNDYSSINVKEGIFLLTVPDEQIIISARKLAENTRINFSRSIFIHFSGALSLDVLQPLKDKNGNIASMHIMQSFHSRKAIPLKNLFCAVESDNDTVKESVFQFAKSLKLNPETINSEDKSLYHLAGVFASNFLFSDLYFAKLLLEKVFPGQGHIMDIIGRLVSTSVSNAINYDIPTSVTGPLIRGDLTTVKKHIEALNGQSSNTLLIKAYIINSLNILDMVEKNNGALTREQKSIKDYLRQFNYI